jgi:hypothetical protein
MRALLNTLFPWPRLRKLELENWQLREAVGLPIPNWVDRKYPRMLAGNAGKNPFRCGTCEAWRRRYERETGSER